MHFISSTRQLILESKKDYCLLLQIYKRASYLDPENCRYLHEDFTVFAVQER